MTATSGFSKKTVDVDTRHFLVEVLKFDNGNFVSVSENSERLGSMVVSLATGPVPVTTTVIPARNESLFLKLTAERISTNTKGIAIVSAYVQRELEPDTAKTLMAAIMELIKT